MNTLKKVLFFILFVTLFLIGGLLIFLIINSFINLIYSDNISNPILRVFGIIFLFSIFIIILKKLDDL